MAKLTFNPRKSIVVTRFSHMDSESEISAPVSYPLASLEDVQGSSGELPSNLRGIKSKQGFSFRWNNRRTGLGVTQPVEKSNARSIGIGLGFRSGTKSNPNLRNSMPKSKTAQEFVKLLLRRSPSWRDKRELKSDTLRQSTSSESSCETSPIPIDPTSNRIPRGTRPVTGLRDLFRQERRPLAESLTGGTVVGVIPSDSELSKSAVENSRSTLPIPPIIISAPTPPDALCFAVESPVESPERKRYHMEVEEHTNFGQIPIMAKALQGAARQLANDPSVTQTNIFRLLAPITIFLYTLGIGVVLLKNEAVIFEPRKASEMAFVIPLGMLLVLALLRGVLWVMSKLGCSFCELDLEEVFARGIFVDSEGERLTEADFIVGNLIT